MAALPSLGPIILIAWKARSLAIILPNKKKELKVHISIFCTKKQRYLRPEVHFLFLCSTLL